MSNAKRIPPIYYRFISIIIAIVLVCQNAVWAGTADRMACLSPGSSVQALGEQAAGLQKTELIRMFFKRYREYSEVLSEQLAGVLAPEDIVRYLKLSAKELAEYGRETFIFYLLELLKASCSPDRARYYQIIKSLAEGQEITEIVRLAIEEELKVLERRKQVMFSALHDTRGYIISNVSLVKIFLNRDRQGPNEEQTAIMLAGIAAEDKYLAKHIQEMETEIKDYLAELVGEIINRFNSITRKAEQYRKSSFASQYYDEMSADIEVFLDMIANLRLVLDVYLKVYPNPYTAYQTLIGQEGEKAENDYNDHEYLRDVVRYMGYIPFILSEAITGRLSRERTTEDLRSLLAGILEERSKYFILSLECSGFSGPPVQAVVNPVHLRRLVSNIFRNTIEARASADRCRSKVTLEVSAEGQVIVRFVNNGGLIKEDEHGSIDYIFNFGFTTKEREGHSGGIGLHNVRRMIELAGGRITAENTEELGEPGVAFVVTLPLVEEKGQKKRKTGIWEKLFSLSWWCALLGGKGKGDFQLSLPQWLNKYWQCLGLLGLGIIGGFTLFGLGPEAGLYLIGYSFSVYAHEIGHLISVLLSRGRLWFGKRDRQSVWRGLPGVILRALKGVFWDLRINIKLPGSAQGAILRGAAAGYMINALLLAGGLVLLIVDYLAPVGAVLVSVNILIFFFQFARELNTISRLTGEKEIVVMGRLIRALFLAFFRGKATDFLKRLRKRQIHKKMIIGDLAVLINPPTVEGYNRLPVFDSGEETNVVIDSEVTAILRELPAGITVIFFGSAAYHFIRGPDGALRDHLLRELTGTVDVCVTGTPAGMEIDEVEDKLRANSLFKVNNFLSAASFYTRSPFTTDRVGVAVFIDKEGRLGPALVDLTLDGQYSIEAWRQMRQGRIEFYPGEEKTVTSFDQLAALKYFFQREMVMAEPVRQLLKEKFPRQPRRLKCWLKQSLDYAAGIDSIEPLSGFLSRVEYLFSDIVEETELLDLIADVIAAKLGTETEQLVQLFFGGTKALSFKRKVFACLKRKNIISTLIEVDQLAEKQVPEDVLFYIIGDSANWPDIARWEEKLTPSSLPAIPELVIMILGLVLLFYSGPQLALALSALPLSAYLHELAHWLVMGTALAVKGKWPRLKLKNVLSFFRSVFWEFSVPNKLPPEAKATVRLTAVSGYLVNFGLVILGILLINSGSYLAVGISLVAANLLYLGLGLGKDILMILISFILSYDWSAILNSISNTDFRALFTGETNDFKLVIKRDLDLKTRFWVAALIAWIVDSILPEDTGMSNGLLVAWIEGEVYKLLTPKSHGDILVPSPSASLAKYRVTNISDTGEITGLRGKETALAELHRWQRMAGYEAIILQCAEIVPFRSGAAVYNEDILAEAV